MKKILLGIVAAILIMAPLTAFAATSDAPAAQAIRSFCGIDFSKLTDAQKTDLNDSFNKMMDLRKESINTMVEDGAITKEQGDAAIKRFDDMAKYREENGFAGGRMGGGIGGPGMGRRGMHWDSTNQPPQATE
jgi:hypothetical protein